jgi:hypothetical protein
VKHQLIQNMERPPKKKSRKAGGRIELLDQHGNYRTSYLVAWIKSVMMAANECQARDTLEQMTRGWASDEDRMFLLVQGAFPTIVVAMEKYFDAEVHSRGCQLLVTLMPCVMCMDEFLPILQARAHGIVLLAMGKWKNPENTDHVSVQHWGVKFFVEILDKLESEEAWAHHDNNMSGCIGRQLQEVQNLVSWLEVSRAVTSAMNFWVIWSESESEDSNRNALACCAFLERLIANDIRRHSALMAGAYEAFIRVMTASPEDKGVIEVFENINWNVVPHKKTQAKHVASPSKHE